MTTAELQRQDQQYLAQTYARFPIALAKGKGCEVWDVEGKHYLDFTSGIGTNSLGWADDTWLQAITQQAATLQHTSNLYYTEPCIQLAQTLCRTSGQIRAFFCNSGAEANEGAIKAARKYSRDRYGDNRFTILTLENSFHGRTLSTLAATGQAAFHQHFFPFTQGFEHLPANDLNALITRTAQQDVCAIMIELVQGEGGVLSLNRDYVAEMARICHEKDILLLIDEVQTGIGRTGKLFAFQHFGVQPDIVTLAKGLGGGLPIGAVLFGQKCAEVFQHGDHGSTFGANPVCCAAANAVLAKLDQAFLAEVSRKGEKLQQALAKLPGVKSVTGMGLMIGVEFEQIQARDVVGKGIEKGVLFLTAKQKLRLLPPLVIRDEQIEQGVAILADILQSI